MMKCALVLLVLLSATGLLELCSRSKFGMGLMELVSDRASQEEVGEHREEWEYHERPHGFGHHRGFHAAMHERMQDTKRCHKSCGTEAACHERCPRPWRAFQERCAGGLMRVASCHASCGRNHACHVHCPLPKCPRAARRFQMAVRCHGSCGMDRACHRNCPHPARDLAMKCGKLDEVMMCHKGCGWDSDCHHTCPKLKELWGHRAEHLSSGLLRYA